MGDLVPDKKKYWNQDSLGMFTQKPSFVSNVQLKLKMIDRYQNGEYLVQKPSFVSKVCSNSKMIDRYQN
jgi:hypothetical protein